MDVTTTAVNLTPLLLDILAFAGILLAGVATWAVKKYVASRLDAQAAALVDSAIKNGINFALNKAGDYIKGAPITVDAHNQLVATAANYAVTHVPEALARVGVTEQQLSDKIIARLPQ